MTTQPTELRFRQADVYEHSHEWQNCLHEFGETQNGTITETGESVTVTKCTRCSLWIIERRP